MPLSKPVYCVAIAFKMTERVEQHVCTKFCIKLERASAESTQAILKAQLGQLVIGGFITMMHLLTHHFLCRVFWWNIKSPRWLGLPTAQTRHPVSSGFSPNWNHLWKGIDFRPLMRFRKIWWGSLWRLGELCEVSRCQLWKGLRYHCPMYLVSCIFFSKCL